MMRDAKAHIDPSPARPSRRRGLIASAMLSLVVVAAACAESSAGPGVAGEGSTSASPSASPSGDLRDAQLAYAQCMRDHGITDFPDPQPGGGIALQGEPGSDLDPDSPQFQDADEACNSLLPPPSGEEEEEAREEMLAYAECMREHGFPDFPDPQPGEGINLDAGEHPEFDSPQFDEASEACGGPGAADTNTQTAGGGS